MSQDSNKTQTHLVRLKKLFFPCPDSANSNPEINPCAVSAASCRGALIITKPCINIHQLHPPKNSAEGAAICQPSLELRVAELRAG